MACLPKMILKWESFCCENLVSCEDADCRDNQTYIYYFAVGSKHYRFANFASDSCSTLYSTSLVFDMENFTGQFKFCTTKPNNSLCRHYSFGTHTHMHTHTHTHTPPPPPAQPFYSLFSGTTRVSRCQKKTSGLYGARVD